MKSTGIVRNIDGLGRVVIPIELRRGFDLDIKDAVEIFTDGDTIILKKLQTRCVFCGNNEDVKNFKGKCLCPQCLSELKKL